MSSTVATTVSESARDVAARRLSSRFAVAFLCLVEVAWLGFLVYALASM